MGAAVILGPVFPVGGSLESSLFFSFSFCLEEKNQVSCRGFDPRGEVFFFWRRRKIKVSCRGFDPRWPPSACETVIAAHMVKQQCLR